MKNNCPPTPWDIGYKIEDRYEIVDIKTGGMGIVYIALDHEWDQFFAIKTFQEQYLWDEDAIQRFTAEAETWIELERHTNIVFASFIRKLEGKPLIFLEYLDCGDLNPFIGKLNIEESLDFAIQFCTGMEYAYQKLGVIHRDIKPGNVMVQRDPRFRSGYVYKITDFGLVKVLSEKLFDDSVTVLTGMGTLLFMSPEQFPDRIQEKFQFRGHVTTRSDVYSFGVTLYLLLTGKLPFDDREEIFTKSPERPKYLNPEIPERLDILIIKCLEKNPNNRYNDFTELKFNLIKIFNNLTGENYEIVGEKEPFTDIDWTNKGLSLNELGKNQEAIVCCDKALEINPRFDGAWASKGNALSILGKPHEAIECFDKALEINPGCDLAWHNKGIALADLGKSQEAIGCFDKALEINPRFALAWTNKGNAFGALGILREEIECYDKALEINPKNADAWNNKGFALNNLGKSQEAIGCYDKALEINPRCDLAWINKVNALSILGKPQEAIECCDKALQINLRYAWAWLSKGIALGEMGELPDAIKCWDNALEINPRYAEAWYNKGTAIAKLGKSQDAIKCWDNALEINPRYADAWYNKGVALNELGKYQEAVVCFDKSLEINPKIADVWTRKGLALYSLGKYQDAIECFETFIEIAPPEYASEVEQAKQIIKELRGQCRIT